ncbi:MAG: septum formation protein Maf [Verrucomicrobia bacterium]|nr:septum formation protein Maf [Verrucomicrobiota bacterium]
MSGPLILASASPRRRELLSSAGYRFEVWPPRVAELAREDFSVAELTTANATRKARAIAAARPRAIVLGADTLVALDGRIIGKPVDLVEAREILRRLSGRTHQVCTGVVIMRGRHLVSFAETSHVTFRALTRREIEHYLRRINPLDKAGAYAAQENDVIAGVDGSFTNVVGLPMERTAPVLRDFGIVAQDQTSTATSGRGSAGRTGSRRKTR